MTAADAGAAASSDGAPIRVVERETTRTARYATLGAEPEDAACVWFVLHGYGQLAARFVRPFEGVVPPDTCVIAPEALSRFYLEAPRTDGGHLQRVGASWLTREARELEIRDAMRWLTSLAHEVISRSTGARGAAPAVGVLGFSQGVVTALRWIASGGVRPTHVIAWAGGFAHDVDAVVLRSALSRSALTLVAGDEDHFATPEMLAQFRASAQAVHPSPVERRFMGAHRLDSSLLRELLAQPHG